MRDSGSGMGGSVALVNVVVPTMAFASSASTAWSIFSLGAEAPCEDMPGPQPVIIAVASVMSVTVIGARTWSFMRHAG